MGDTKVGTHASASQESNDKENSRGYPSCPTLAPVWCRENLDTTGLKPHWAIPLQTPDAVTIFMRFNCGREVSGEGPRLWVDCSGGAVAASRWPNFSAPCRLTSLALLVQQKGGGAPL